MDSNVTTTISKIYALKSMSSSKQTNKEIRVPLEEDYDDHL